MKLKYKKPPKKSDLKYFSNFSNFQIVMLCEFEILTKDPKFGPWDQRTFVSKFKNDWIINQFKGVPISVRSLFQVDIQKIIPFLWSNTHEEYSKENHLHLFYNELSVEEIKEIDNVRMTIYSNWDEKFRKYNGTKTEFLKDGGYVEQDVVYQWDDILNQYVATKKNS